jgi:Alpha galactosidase C-terminal beta sandwich domain/Melibiase
MSRLTRGLTALLIAMPMVAAPAVGTVLASAPAAQAEANPPPGTDLKPVLGWSSWSFFRDTSDAATIEAAARAMKQSGLERLGYRYVNLDDFWYQCPGHQGPNVDQFGRWVVRSDKFPQGRGGENGIETVADYVHSLGLKFGIYVTPGISDQAVAKNTPIMGTHYTADQIATKVRQNNYNCGGMTGIDYAKPGAQPYVNSIVDELARWGVDYIKLDGITDSNAPDIEAWSNAIRQLGRPMQLDVTEGSYTVALGPTLDKYATQWEYTSDIENYGGRGLTSYPNVAKRFTTLALWEPRYGGRVFNGYNDFDSVEVGNCRNAVGGVNLTRLCRPDLKLLENRAVLSVEQDGIDASMITNGHTAKVIAKTERNGDVVVGLFNTTAKTEVISTKAFAIGLPGGGHYRVTNLWTHRVTSSGTTISAKVRPQGVAFYRISPA